MLGSNGQGMKYIKSIRVSQLTYTPRIRLSALYRSTQKKWGGGGENNDPDNLEALGGGFNVTLEALQDRDRRSRIAAKLNEFAVCMDNVVRVINENN